MDCPWETDNDTDKDIETLPNAFSGLRKGFLLRKPPDRTESERSTTSAQNAPETQANHTQDDVLKEIQYLRYTYGDSPGENSMLILYAEANKFF
jgi:hypothetical protein